MPITIRDLLDVPDLGLEVVAGKAGLDRQIRWVHTSELADPTPWLSGGELLLTTGMALAGSAALQRSYIRRLVERDLAGLGIGLGFGFEAIPDPVLRAAERQGFPVIEVAYPVPFIAIAEAVAKALTEDRLRDAQMSVELHERLAMLVTEGAGPADVLEEVTSLSGGWAMLFDPRGNLVARSPAPAPAPAEVWTALPADFSTKGGATTAAISTPDETRLALMVTAGKRHEGAFVFGRPGRIEERDRIVVHHAATVLGLLLASRRSVIDAERRVAGDILSEAFAGRLEGSDLEKKIELLGFEPAAPLTTIVVEVPGISDATRMEDLAWTVDSALGSRAGTVRTTLMGARIAGLVTHDDPVRLAGSVLEDLDSVEGLAGLDESVRIGVGETVSSGEIRHSYLSAVFALRAARRSHRVTSPADLGSYAFLLGAQAPSVLEGYVRSVLGPLIERDRDRSSELVGSVRAFVEHGGRWEPGAEALGIHRHTLRYRVHQAEELLGRDLSTPQDRMEVWLALKAMDLLEE